MRLRALAVALVLTGLAACTTVRNLDAATDVHALLLSIRDNDQAAFDSHVDRPALKRELQTKVIDKAVRRDSSGLAAFFAPALADIAGDALLQPYVFRLVAEHYGYRPDMAIPGPLAIASVLKPLPDGRVCATRKKDGPCELTFAKLEGSWRLTGFEGDPSLLKVRP
jgi:hypothetical protein